MKFFSTANRQEVVDFESAVFNSLPRSGGLFYPERIPTLFDKASDFLSLTNEEIALRIARAYVGNEIPEQRLQQLVEEVISFPFPLERISDNISSLELYHGPTWAFKDLGARFLSRCMGYFTERAGKEITILVATSGDTGGAVAAGFYQVPGVKVKILFPKGKVSKVQQLQLTTWGGNIEAFEIDGTFDDCQRLVKTAFNDTDLQKNCNLSSANSINIARLIPQSFYYFFAVKQLGNDEDIVISVPSGNFGNLTAGLMAWKMGLPVKRFIAATNSNHIVPDYLKSGNYEPRKSMETYANAMDVGDPSNFVRMLELFGTHESMKSMVSGFWLDNNGILESMQRGIEKYDYLTDPHGAIGLKALESSLNADESGIFLETAHPVKFLDVVNKVPGVNTDFEEKTRSLFTKTSEFRSLSSDFKDFKELLMA